uniref:Unspecified product n=1 Tax=Strongyloides papillosus TaxID=174720 RepID=A0A0N5B6D6_STREA
MLYIPFENYKRIFLKKDEPLMANIYTDDVFSHASPKNTQYFHHLRTHPALSELPSNYIMQHNPLHYSRIQSRDIIILVAILISLFIILLMTALILTYKKYRKYRKLISPTNKANLTSTIHREIKYIRLENGHVDFSNDSYGSSV